MKIQTHVIGLILWCGLPMAALCQAAQVTPSLRPEGSTQEFRTIDARRKNQLRADMATDWGSYRYFRFEPVAYEPLKTDHKLSQRETAKVQTRLVTALDGAFANPQPDAGKVLVVKPVITDVKRTNALANMVSFAAFQIVVSYGGAGVRFDLVDAATGQKVGEMSSYRNARPWNVYPWDILESFKSVGQSSVILKSDAKLLRKDLQRLAKLQSHAAAALVNGAE